MIKQEPPDPTIAIQNAARLIQPVPIKLEDLDGIGKYNFKINALHSAYKDIPIFSVSNHNFSINWISM